MPKITLFDLMMLALFGSGYYFLAIIILAGLAIRPDDVPQGFTAILGALFLTVYHGLPASALGGLTLKVGAKIFPHFPAWLVLPAAMVGTFPVIVGIFFIFAVRFRLEINASAVVQFFNVLPAHAYFILTAIQIPFLAVSWWWLRRRAANRAGGRVPAAVQGVTQPLGTRSES